MDVTSIAALNRSAAPAVPAQSTAATRHGTVAWYNPVKGFGFIHDDAAPKDLLFVHYANVEAVAGVRELREGQRVSFDMGDGQKGLQALNVRIED